MSDAPRKSKKKVEPVSIDSLGDVWRPHEEVVGRSGRTYVSTSLCGFHVFDQPRQAGPASPVHGSKPISCFLLVVVAQGTTSDPDRIWTRAGGGTTTDCSQSHCATSLPDTFS